MMGSMYEVSGVLASSPESGEIKRQDDKTQLQQASASASVQTLKMWLCDKTLSIPQYQRPYKWGLPQVLQLLSDIEQQAVATTHEMGASSYRIGTVVVHVHVEQAAEGRNGTETQADQTRRTLHHIVDGQQRTVTLLLVLHALRAKVNELPETQQQAWQKELLKLELFEPEFPSPLSHRHVQANYQAIARHVRQAQWGQAQVLFLLERCEVVRIKLHNLTEAFQFFDAQNGRGKALCVHDLLKAFHLRALRPAELALRGQAVRAWEQCSQDDLERLFAHFLFQIRQRSRGRNAEFFGKRHVGVFKGISLEASGAAPMSRAWRMLDDAVHLLESHTGTRGQEWPCQLDAPVVNGLRFFDWVQHYWGMGFHLKHKKGQLPPWVQRFEQALGDDARKILLTIGTYKGRDRKGDSHVRAVFDALLLYYLDKFGEQGLSQAVELAFAWAYARLLNRRVMVGSMDKFVSEGEVNPFAVLRDAVVPQEFLNISLPLAHYHGGQPPVQGLEVFEKLMQKLGYWQQDSQKEEYEQ